MDGTSVTSTDTGAVTTGPATFSDPGLSWSEDSSSSAPSSASTPADSASADATVPPAATAAPTEGSTTPADGAPPPERWPDILANARQKAVAEWEQQYGWAKQVNPQEFQQVVEMARRASSDPIAYLQDFLKELQGHPVHGAQLKTLHAKALAAARGQQSAQPEQEPQPDLPIQLEDGRVVHLYSADQQAKREAFLQKQWMQSVQQELQPLKQSHEQLQAEKAAIARQQEVDRFVSTQTEDVKTWPHMESEDNRKALAAKLATFPDTDDPREVALHLNAAYRAVMKELVLPKLSQTAEAKLLDTLKTKAAASNGINPGSAASSSPKAVTRFADLPPDAWK